MHATIPNEVVGCYPGHYVDRFGEKPAVIDADSDRHLTYRELDLRSQRLARVLYDAGLRRGDHLAVLSNNDPIVFEIYWAAMRSGLYLTAINWHLTSAEVAYIVEDCGAKALVVSAELADTAESLRTGFDAVSTRLAFRGEVSGFASYESALCGASSQPLPDQPRGADMLYSSGTTGRPKGIKTALPQRRVDEPGDPYVELFGRVYGFGIDTVYLSPAPLYHAAPLRFGGVVQALGGTVVMMQRFDPELALAAIERHRVTHGQWVPTMFVRMLKLTADIRDKYDLSSMRVAVHAAAPCPVDVKHAMIEWWGPILHEYYSSTEGNGVTFVDSHEWLQHPGSVGRAAVGTLHVCDEHGVELPVGEIGSIYFEREERPFEYHGDPEKTKRATHPRHPTWTTTGDLGYVDDDGFLYLTDRLGFMIISGGVNIYPQEIENALALHPRVVDVAVIGVPDDVMGESVHAVVIPAAGSPPGGELAHELTGFLRLRIAGYKVPRSYSFVDQLPRTPTGKLAKTHLATSIAGLPTFSSHKDRSAS